MEFRYLLPPLLGSNQLTVLRNLSDLVEGFTLAKEKFGADESLTGMDHPAAD